MNVDVFFAIFAKKVKKLRVGSDGGCALEIANGEGGIRTRPSCLMLQNDGFRRKPFFRKKLRLRYVTIPIRLTHNL